MKLLLHLERALLAATLSLALSGPSIAFAQGAEAPSTVEPSSEAAAPAPQGASAGDTEVVEEVPRPLPLRPEAPPPTPETPEGRTLTLEEAQQIALERNPSVRMAAVELDRADALIRQAWAALFPNLGANLQYTMADQPTIVSFGADASLPIAGASQDIVVRQQHVATLGVSARQPLFSPQALPSIRLANESRELSELSVEQTRRQIALTVAQAFYSTISARRTLSLIERNLELAQEDVRAARARLAVQAGLAIDVARAELQVERTRLQREQTLLGFQNARDGLALLMGVPPDELPPLAEPEPPAGISAERTLDDFVDRAMERRLDLRQARHQRRLAEQNLRVTRWSFAPSLDLNWVLSYTLTDLGGFGDRRTTWNLVVLLNIPLFDGGFRYGQLRDRRAQLRQAELAREALEQNVAMQVRQAYRAWRSSQATLEISRRQLRLALEAHRLARAAYENGAGTNLAVVDAQRTLAAAQVDVELQRLNSQLALIELIGRLEVGPGGGGAPTSSGAAAPAASSGGMPAASSGGMPAGSGGGMPAGAGGGMPAGAGGM